MRMIAVSSVTPGMIVAQPIYGLNGEVLVKQLGKVTERVLKKLKELGWNYLYIEDELSMDVEVKCTISPIARSEAIVNVRKLFMAIAANRNHDMETISKRVNFSPMLQACLKSVDDLLEEIIRGSIKILDIYDVKMVQNYKYAHSVNVCIISIILGIGLGYDYKQLYELGAGAILHDMGQEFLPDEIQFKSTKYTDEDYKIMQKHPELGYRFARDHFDLPTRSFLAILQHHERYDGSGYPMKKTSEEVNEFSKIVAVADVFDALTSDKPYREPMLPVGAFKYIITNNKKAFDPKIVKVFFEKVSPYPIGFTLHMKDGRDVIVIENIEGRPLYPKVKVIKYKGIPLDKTYTMILES